MNKVNQKFDLYITMAMRMAFIGTPEVFDPGSEDWSLKELLQLISVHVPQGSSLPKSLHTLKRFFIEAFPHIYCSFCLRPLPSRDTKCSGRSCRGGSSGVFITIALGPQLKQLMEGIHNRSCKPDRQGEGLGIAGHLETA